MKNILTIVKKELSRIFKDPRLIIMTFIFPGLMIYGMYSLVGEAFKVTDDAEYVVYTVNMPDEYQAIVNAMNDKVEFMAVTSDEVNNINEDIKNNEALILINFENDFKGKAELKEKPDLEIYYNPANKDSNAIYEIISRCNEMYRNLLLDEFYGDAQVFEIKEYIVYEEEKAMALVVSQLLPFLIITFLYQGAISVAPESIAGEKERGTMATLLVTPTKRSEIALGKVTALSILATLSAISSFIGIILSLPKLIGLSGAEANIYGVGDYMITLVILIVTVLTLIGLISVISAYAKNTKEASLLVLPLMLISMGIGISSMITEVNEISTVAYLIPIFNSVQMLTQIFSFHINTTQLLVTIISNVLYTGLLTFVLTRMFNSEKIMFSK